MKKLRDFLWGLAIVTAGLVWGLSLIGIIKGNIFFEGWWTIFLIVPAAINLITGFDRLGSLIALIIGTVLLLSYRNIFGDIALWKIIVPLVIIAIGIKIIVKALFSRSECTNSEYRHNEGISKERRHKTHNAVFSGEDIKIGDEPYNSHSVNAVFGGADLDLRSAVIRENMVIDAVALFGGVEIYLPQGVNVKVNSTALFGGVDYPKTLPHIPNASTVTVNATAIFGGIDLHYQT